MALCPWLESLNGEAESEPSASRQTLTAAPQSYLEEIVLETAASLSTHAACRPEPGCSSLWLSPSFTPLLLISVCPNNLAAHTKRTCVFFPPCFKCLQVSKDLFYSSSRGEALFCRVPLVLSILCFVMVNAPLSPRTLLIHTNDQPFI